MDKEEQEIMKLYLEKCKAAFPEILEDLEYLLEFAFEGSEDERIENEFKNIFLQYGDPEFRQLDLLRDRLYHKFLKYHINELRNAIKYDSFDYSQYHISNAISILMIMYSTLKTEKEMDGD